MQEPSVFDTLSHRDYLQRWFDWKKASNTRYSHRAFAMAAGQRSPSLLLNVIKGRRNLTDETVTAFCKAMKLPAADAGFFRLLWAFDAANTPEERNAAWRRIAATQHFRRSHRLEGEAFRYLSTWYLPAIRELALCPGFRPNPSWIARTLRPRIREREAAAALTTLQDLGMLHIDGDVVTVQDVSVSTPHEVTGLAVHNYHRQMLDRARDGIEDIAPAERHLAAITVAVPSSLLPDLKTQIGRFLEDMLERCDASAEPHEQVVQLGVQLTPLSHHVPSSPELP
jgi:uncharacterized protein (TIGR02147 family)